MTLIVYVICVDSDNDKYLAFAWNGSELLKSVSYISGNDAVGVFVREHPDLPISRVVDVDGE